MKNGWRYVPGFDEPGSEIPFWSLDVFFNGPSLYVFDDKSTGYRWSFGEGDDALGEGLIEAPDLPEALRQAREQAALGLEALAERLRTTSDVLDSEIA